MKKRTETILLLAITCFWFASYIHIPYQTPYLTSAGISAGAIGTIVGAYGVVQLILRLPVGLMADRAGRSKPVVILGCALSAAACAVRVLMPDGTGFLIANLISGCASSTWISFMVLFSTYYSRQEQQKATSRTIMACNLGMCVSFIFATCLYSTTGMRFLCALGMCGGAFGVILAFTVQEAGRVPGEDSARQGTVSTRITIKELLRVCTDHRLILFSLLALIQQGIQMATAMSFTTQILEDLGASSGVIGGASIFYMVVAVTSARFASTELCARRGARFYIPLVFFLTGIYCILVPLAGSPLVIFVLQALPGMSSGILLSYLTSESMRNVPEEKKSTAMGFFQAIYAVGMSSFPAVVGALTECANIALGYAFLAAAAFLGMAAALLYYGWGRRNASWSASSYQNDRGE